MRHAGEFHEFAITQENDIVPMTCGADTKQCLVLQAPLPEDVEGDFQVLGRQPRLLREAGGGEVVEVAPDRGRLQLDQTLRHEALHVPVDDPDRHPEVHGKLALRDRRVAVDLDKDLTGQALVRHAAGLRCRCSVFECSTLFRRKAPPSGPWRLPSARAGAAGIEGVNTRRPTASPIRPETPRRITGSRTPTRTGAKYRLRHPRRHATLPRTRCTGRRRCTATEPRPPSPPPDLWDPGAAMLPSRRTR